MLTVDQLVKMLQLPPKETVYFRNKYGKGPSYYRVGRYIRFNKSDVLKWLEDQQTDW
jgi:predicted DNA-binding transcriptional regulator AlpA